MNHDEMPASQWQARADLKRALFDHRSIKASLRMLRPDTVLREEYKRRAKFTRWSVRRAVAILRFTIKFPRP